MTEPHVRPDVRAFLEMMKSFPRPQFSDEVIAQMRLMPPEMIAAQMAMLELDLGELGEVRDVTMPGPAGEISLRLFDPRQQRGPGPVVVFYHGGGFCVGSIDSHGPLAAEIARGLDLPVVSVEYRLSPENPWPAPIDDAEAAARWVAENGAAFGREFTGLVLAGDSAGGTLTIVTALALRDKPATVPVLLQWPIYPATDASQRRPSRDAFGAGFGLEDHDMNYFDAAYGGDRSHPRRSPLLAEQAGLPPTFVVTAGLDPLRDEGRDYAARAIEAGVPVTFREVAGTVHGFCTYRRAIASAPGDLAALLAVARAMLAESRQAAV